MAHLLHGVAAMPHFRTDRFHTNHARDKREEELQDYSPHALVAAYEVACGLPLGGDRGQLPREAMVAAILEKEFGPID